jgi:hypothetical protein
MMAEVACFCGCLYSFHGGAGACPRCGEYATVMTAAVSASAGRSHYQRSESVSVVREDAGRANGRELPVDLLLTAVSSGLAHRYAPGPRA